MCYDFSLIQICSKSERTENRFTHVSVLSRILNINKFISINSCWSISDRLKRIGFLGAPLKTQSFTLCEWSQWLNVRDAWWMMPTRHGGARRLAAWPAAASLDKVVPRPVTRGGGSFKHATQPYTSSASTQSIIYDIKVSLNNGLPHSAVEFPVILNKPNGKWWSLISPLVSNRKLQFSKTIQLGKRKFKILFYFLLNKLGRLLLGKKIGFNIFYRTKEFLSDEKNDIMLFMLK